MHYKLTFLLLLSTVLNVSGQERYRVSAQVDGLGSAELLVLHFRDDTMPILDTLRSADDRFEFSGMTDIPYFVQILMADSAGRTRKLCEFMLENSNITVTGRSIRFDDITVTGSESDRVLKEYLEQDQMLRIREENYRIKYEMAKEAGDILLIKSPESFTERRIELLKEYVSLYKDQVVGALLPNFCLLEKELLPEDYAELYDVLHPDIRETAYGLMIRSKSQFK